MIGKIDTTEINGKKYVQRKVNGQLINDGTILWNNQSLKEY